MCLEIYELDIANKFSAGGLACPASFKEAKVKFDVLTNTDKFLMVEKGIRGEILILFIDVQKLITNKNERL